MAAPRRNACGRRQGRWFRVAELTFWKFGASGKLRMARAAGVGEGAAGLQPRPRRDTQPSMWSNERFSIHQHDDMIDAGILGRRQRGRWRLGEAAREARMPARARSGGADHALD